MSETRVGVLGLGLHLPATVRENSWWPDEVVAGWQRALQSRHVDPADQPHSEGERLVREAFAALADDPFRGAVRRHVLASDCLSVDMEQAASEEAILAADLDRAQIDLLLVSATVPDLLGTNHACSLHQRLGLARRCLTMTIEATCAAPAQQLAIADGLIRSGRARTALLVQSTALSRLLPQNDPRSASFGDGAAAMLVGQVGPSHGLLAMTHATDGTLQGALVTGVPGRRWYDEGAMHYYAEKPAAARAQIRGAADTAREAIAHLLDRIGARGDEVDFYAAHQGFPWFRQLTQAHAGLAGARYQDTFAFTGNLCGANVACSLTLAERDGQLHDGDLIVGFAAGTGAAWSAFALKWGRT